MKRAISRLRRGFTLVELMIVVAIIGILAALAIYGVSRFLSSSKSSEAKNSLGGISRNADEAFKNGIILSEGLGEGNESQAVQHQLCDSAANAVPAAGVPKGVKYQPKSGTGIGSDYGEGTTSAGWVCLKFKIDSPHYYQYHYNKNTQKTAAALGPGTNDYYEAAAIGDLNGDANIYSKYAQTGRVNDAADGVRRNTQLYVENETE